jgi:galactokinase
MTSIDDGNAFQEFFIPGRHCLFGEHTDWSGGLRRFNPAIAFGRTIVSGTNQGLFAKVRRHPSSLIVRSILPPSANLAPQLTDKYAITIEQTNDQRFATLKVEMDDLQSLKALAIEGGFFSYVAGVAFKIKTNHNVLGLEVNNYKSTLPVGKGLSSSAAICVLLARGFSRCFDLKGTARFEMEYAYLGESMTPSRCGRMDQAGCAFGQRPVLMAYDGDDVEVDEIKIGKTLHYLLVDLGYPHKSTTEILKGLQAAYPFPQGEKEEAVHHLFGDFNIGITTEAVEALREGDAVKLGSLMTKAQTEFDRSAAPLCPSQLTMPLLHSVLAHSPLQELIHGGKGVGSQGDGTLQLLCKNEACLKAAMLIINKDFPAMDCLELSLQPTDEPSS